RRSHAGLLSSAVLSSVPEFVLASLLISFIAIQLGYLPATGWDGLSYAILPVISLTIPISGMLSRILLIAVDTAANEPWVRTWLVNGIPGYRVRRSLIRRGFATLTPQIFLFFAGTLASTALVENIFSIPGIGRIAVQAATHQDVPVMQALLTVVLFIGVACGFLSRCIHYFMMRPVAQSHDAGLSHGHTHIDVGWTPPLLA
ncbi:ABC transporter permease subunit, partial [Klebsiella pneumoniae]|uniref:ABC transporter permease subunit n=2 Tax=Bacteria TaxID=2 RepID=UPI0010AA63BB